MKRKRIYCQYCKERIRIASMKAIKTDSTASLFYDIVYFGCPTCGHILTTLKLPK